MVKKFIRNDFAVIQFKLHLTNHGNPNPIKIANLFDAIAPQMLISAFEFFFFMMIALVIMSGIAEPKDKIVIPATTSDNPINLPENKHKNNFMLKKLG